MSFVIECNKNIILDIKNFEVIMPRDFKEFVKNNENFKKVDENKLENHENTQKYEEILNKYKDMDQNSLMSNLLQEASRLKREGKLNNESLNSIRTTLAPFLNEGQQEMLNELVDAIKNQT